MTDVGNHQDVVKKSCLHLLRNKPFKLGLEGSLYSPDDFFTDKWDQINYERGFHFRAILKREGLRPSQIGRAHV